MKTISVRTAAGFRPWRAFVILAAAGTLLAVAAVRDEPKSRELILVDNLTTSTAGVATWNADGVTTCTAAGTDDAAYSLSGYKLPANGSPYKVNTGTVPTYLSASAVQTAVVAA